ncbi:MAG: O-antigen ligase family protein [bacterium]
MQTVIVNTLYLLAILIPLTFTTVNYELFEFPKFLLLLSGALIISLAWIIDLIQKKNLRSTLAKLRSPISLAVLLILLTQTLATIFSIHPYTSFWGYYSRFHQGLLTTICYTIIYFSSINWLDNKSTQKLIKLSIYTSFIISLYAIAEHFGIDKNFWVQDVQNRVFSSLGQPNWLAAYLLPNIFLVLYLLQTNKKSTSPIRYYSIFVALFLALLFTKSRSGFLAFSLSYLTYWLLLLRQLNYSKIKKSLIHTTFYLLLTTIIIGTPFTPSLSSILKKELAPPPTLSQGTVLESGGTESGEIRKIVWTGALSLIGEYPLLGTGPETFAYTYYWTRPMAHNYTSEWDFLYNKAHNEYLNFAATSGLIGLAAYLYFHYVVVKQSLLLIPKSKKTKQTPDHNLRHFLPVLGASLVGFAVTNFFGFSVIPVYLTMIFLAVFPSTLNQEPLSSTKLIFFSQYLIFPLVLIIPLRLFLADLTFNKGKAYLSASRPEQAIPLLEKAVSYRKNEDLYHSFLGEAYAQLAASTNNPDTQALAIKEVEFTRSHNPFHLNYSKSRAKVYLTLATIKPEYNLQAAEELLSASVLAPTDPKIAYNLGLVYSRLGNTEGSIKQMETAITLKNNYQEAYYALTLLYEQTNQPDLIAPLLENARNNLATYSASLKEKMDKYLLE